MKTKHRQREGKKKVIPQHMLDEFTCPKSKIFKKLLILIVSHTTLYA